MDYIYILTIILNEQPALNNLFTKYYFAFFIIIISFINSVPQEILQENFYLQTRDGIKLDCSLYTQKEYGNSLNLPAIIFCHGFGKSKDDNYIDAIEYAKSGFCSFTYTFRGQGLSEGKTNFIDTTDMYDLFEIVSFVKSMQFIDTNKIIVSGASQGGIIPLMASVNGLDVRCIITDLISFDYMADWLYNNTIKTSFIWSLGYSKDIVRYDSTIFIIRNKILTSNVHNPLVTFSNFISERDFSKYIDRIKIPILICNSWGDKFFSANSIIENLGNIPSGHNLYFGYVKGHGSKDYATETEYHSELMKDWIERNIYTDDKNNVNYYTYAATKYDNKGNIILNRYSSNKSPFINTGQLTLYFDKYNKLSIGRVKENGFYKIKNEVTDSTLNLKEALYSEFSSEKFKKGFLINNIILDSDILMNDYFFLGIPKAEMHIKTSSPFFQLNIQIYEIINGIQHFITCINYNGSNHNINKLVEYLFNGISVGHIFSKGNKIRIIITNIDLRTNDIFLRTNPFILPLMKNFLINIFYGANGSKIILPLFNDYK